MALVPADVVTVTSTAPTEPAGEVAVIEFALLTVNVADAVPNFTLVAPVKLVPVIVTLVPPAVEPDVGLIAVTAGAGAEPV